MKIIIFLPIHTSIDSKNNDIVIPLMSEELVVTKKEVTDEVTITKKPLQRKLKQNKFN